MTGVVERIRIAGEASAPMGAVERVEAVAGRGLRGDRYFKGEGYYPGGCEVTLIRAEALEEIHEEFGIDLTDGRHRRNVVTRGVEVGDLLGERFRVGGAILRGTKPRPPCAHVEQVAGEEGVARALRNRRGGVCAAVIATGPIAVGDEVARIDADRTPSG